MKLPVDKVEDFQDEYLRAMRDSHADVLASIARGEMDAEIEQVLKQVAAEVAGNLSGQA